MSSGFSEEKIEVSVNKQELQKILKTYKKIKKYQKSSLYKIKCIDGAETLIKNLLKDMTNDG